MSDTHSWQVLDALGHRISEGDAVSGHGVDPLTVECGEVTRRNTSPDAAELLVSARQEP